MPCLHGGGGGFVFGLDQESANVFSHFEDILRLERQDKLSASRQPRFASYQIQRNLVMPIRRLQTATKATKPATRTVVTKVWITPNSGRRARYEQRRDRAAIMRSRRMIQAIVLMRHQRRYRHRPQHFARDAAKNDFLQARMSVASHDEQIEAFISRDR